MENKYKYYIEDCLETLIERSIEARDKAELTNMPFDQGKSLGSYEAINFLLQQAEVFEIKEELKERIKSYTPTI